MPHTARERYSELVDAKLRATIVKRVGVICNNRYEGTPKAGAVKVPVRDTEVAVADYNKKTGSTMTHGDTSYLTVTIDKDKAVNELIDGFDAESVPGNLVADRLDSAGYSLALQMEKDGSAELTTGGTVFAYCQTIGQACDLGFRIVLDGTDNDKKLLFELYRPKLDPNARYAPQYGNLTGLTYTESITDYKNIVTVAVKSEARLVWTTYANCAKGWRTYDISIPDGVDYVQFKTRCDNYTSPEVTLARGGTTRHLFDSGTSNTYCTIAFQSNGTLHVVNPYNGNSSYGYAVEYWISGYHYPTLADLLAAQADTEAMTVDQEYRITLLELGLDE